jgi:hypothetical protein
MDHRKRKGRGKIGINKTDWERPAVNCNAICRVTYFARARETRAANPTA